MLRFKLPSTIAICSLLALAACGSRPAATILHPVAEAVGGRSVKVLVATTREHSKTDPYGFSAWRAPALNYAQYDVSIPPNHVNGAIEWPSTSPGNPAKDMVVRSAQDLDRSGFAQQLAGQKDGRVVVFVHGYNSTYQEAVFRLAEIKTDGNFPGTAIAFAWPSRGTLTGYVADRESANYSRDYFVSFLNDLAASPNVKNIAIVAHSMGNWLTLESLRSAKLRGDPALMSKLDDVFLIAPDVDIDVFRKQLDVIGRLKNPMTVLVSADDVALSASQSLAGGVPRVGNASPKDPIFKGAIETYGLRVVDMSNVESDDYLKHSKFTAILPQLHEVVLNDSKNAARDPFTATGLLVLDTAGYILKAPGEILTGQ